MKATYRYLFLLLLPFVFTLQACKDDSSTTPTPAINEADVLVKYLEANGDYLNVSAPAIMTAEEVRTYQLTKPDKIKIIDIRAAADFAKGRIEGSVNVTLGNIVNYYKDNNGSTFERVAIVCYSGQTGGYAAALLRLLGYSNVFDMKWGMSAWNDSVENKWKPAVGNNYSGFVTTPAPKATTGTLPKLSTGKTDGKAILEARINALLSTTDPFGDIKTTYATVTANPSNYYIVNYWPDAHYTLGHLPGAIQYTPKADLKLSTNLLTLPTDKPIVIYCYTGQTSAQVAAILKVFGYDAKSLLFGVSTMNYNLLTTNNLSTWKDTECKYYPVVK